MNYEKNIDKKVKYGFNPNTLGRERPNLFVNVNKHEVKNTNITASAKINNKMDTHVNTDVYIVNNIKGGGTLKYKNDIKAKYTNVNFIEVPNKKTISNIHFTANDVLFVQQLLFTDLVPRDILNIKYKYSSKIIISIHDFCWITDVFNNSPKDSYYQWVYLMPNIKIHADIIELFVNADLVIHPSYFTYEIYRKWFPINNFIVSYHNDYITDYSTKRIPPIINNQINIGVMHEYMEYKGSEVISYLVKNIIRYEGYHLNYLIVGKTIGIYQEDEFYEYVKKYNIHFLLLLNKWGETYCYSLTKYINSGLPILYNNIGACKYRIPPNVEHYKKVIDNEGEYRTISKVIGERLTDMLDYVIRENGKYNKENTSTIIHYSPLFENLFNLDIRMINYSKVHAKVKPFCIYFPQFHTLAENNTNYYSGMTDITNLKKYLTENKNVHNLMTPSKEILNLSEPLKYDLTDSILIQKQVDIAKSFGIYGFAVYYYWFSVNSITNKHLIMENCFNNFFNESVKLGDNFKVYFIWANEDWTNNAAFNTSYILYIFS